MPEIICAYKYCDSKIEIVSNLMLSLLLIFNSMLKQFKQLKQEQFIFQDML